MMASSCDEKASTVAGMAPRMPTTMVAIPAPYTMGDSASTPPSARFSTWRRWPRNQMNARAPNVPMTFDVRIALRWLA